MGENKPSTDGVCGDNRFELVAKYRIKLIDGTNIEDRPEEMAVIDNILFRFWQMGWLDRLEKSDNEGQNKLSDPVRIPIEALHKKLKECKSGLTWEASLELTNRLLISCDKIDHECEK